MDAQRRAAGAFLLLEGALYAAFLTLDLFFPARDSRYLKYTAIALCLAYALFLVRRGGDGAVALALALTLGADTFLLLLDRWYLVGVLLFFAVQVVYFFRLAPLARRGGLPGAAAALALLLLLLLRLDLLDVLTGAAAVYITLFAWNVARSLRWRTRMGRLFTAGLCLYFLCDLCVGVHNAPMLFPAPLRAFADVGMWLFYLPGQACITLSAKGRIDHGQNE